MKIEPTLSEATSFSTAALKEMAARDIVPTPHNYAVWFHYVSCSNYSLVDEIDKAESGNVPFDEGMGDYLYHKYVEQEDQTEKKSGQSAKQLLTDLLHSISALSGEQDQYQQEMDGHISELESAGTSGDLETMVGQIVGATKALKESSEQLHHKLDQSRAEVVGLKQNLVEATNAAQRDFLTGLFNRKAMDSMLDELIQASQQQKLPLSLLMIDIDHFKKFNDTHGHLIGDEVLKTVAKVLTDTLKGRDVVARFGGEEFAVLLPTTALDNARIVANNLCQSIASKELRRRDTGDTVGQITVSMGVAMWRPGMDTVPLFLKRADEALYRSKDQGRNRVSIESQPKAA